MRISNKKLINNGRDHLCCGVCLSGGEYFRLECLGCVFWADDNLINVIKKINSKFNEYGK